MADAIILLYVVSNPIHKPTTLFVFLFLFASEVVQVKWLTTVRFAVQADTRETLAHLVFVEGSNPGFVRLFRGHDVRSTTLQNTVDCGQVTVGGILRYSAETAFTASSVSKYTHSFTRADFSCWVVYVVLFVPGTLAWHCTV